eukprot:TRINITY_DN2919_c0_g1_i10.p2 TRINITY_DN2919_c0_g1~~TRINITY_DN2919_c0_g1_i10.p2  ORF type:complete len:191 (+),score=24.82 TRINITY_DN2919_c0_g1_i10:540-1112(+)
MLNTDVDYMQNRFQIIKNSTAKMVQASARNDLIGFVSFNDVASAFNDTLIQATDENISILVDYISKLEAYGTTNYTNAFEMAFNILEKTFEEGLSKSDDAFIQFFTDGSYLESSIIDFLKTKIQKLNKTVTIFTYAVDITEENNIQILQQIACEFNGIFQVLKGNSEDSLMEMQQYYQFLGALIQKDGAV